MSSRLNNDVLTGAVLMMLFVLWTILIQVVDVRNAGVNGSEIGFTRLNCFVHSAIGTNMALYTITDWLGLVPVLFCLVLGGVGLWQMIKRRSILKVDIDIILLGVYYIIVIGAYLTFEMIPINYRPVMIEGRMEASYPSSTTLLVLCVMPTVSFQCRRRFRNITLQRISAVIIPLFSIFMVCGRLVSGVHWVTDIIGSILFSGGIYLLYKGTVYLAEQRR